MLKVFKKYAFDFLSAYHSLNEDGVLLAKGLNILGTDDKKSELVAMTMLTSAKSEEKSHTLIPISGNKNGFLPARNF